MKCDYFLANESQNTNIAKKDILVGRITEQAIIIILLQSQLKQGKIARIEIEIIN